MKLRIQFFGPTNFVSRSVASGCHTRQLRDSTVWSKGGTGGEGGYLREAASRARLPTKPVPPDPSAVLKGESPRGLDLAAPGPSPSWSPRAFGRWPGEQPFAEVAPESQDVAVSRAPAHCPVSSPRSYGDLRCTPYCFIDSTPCRYFT